MRDTLKVAALLFWVPVLLGTLAKITVDAYRGDADVAMWFAIGLFIIAWIWGLIERRLKKPEPAPRQFTIYDWTEEPDGVRFHARYDDGEELEFVHVRGMTGTRKEASA